MPASRLSVSEIVDAIQNTVFHELIDDQDTAVLCYDLDFLHDRICELQAAFPDNTVHAVAVKANPLLKVLRKLTDWKMGLEVASLPELHLALKAGADPETICFDSPAKTFGELEFALKQRVHLNLDNFQEVERVARLLKSLPVPEDRCLGLRVNPQVGRGAIPETGVSAEMSKFGVPLEQQVEIVRTFKTHSWLNGLHLHIGSQGCPLELLLRGVEKILGLADLIARETGRSVEWFDLGGGLPVPYADSHQFPSLTEYADALQEAFPQLFDGRYRLITEFGRAVHANAGWALSEVEYTKHQGQHHLAVIHLGADFALRECYHPENWSHDFFALSRTNDSHKLELKPGPTSLWPLAGPLCFAGDYPGRHVHLPDLSPGDFVVMRDVGAYTLSMWSRYNSRQMPKVLGYRKSASGSYLWELLKARETVEEAIALWE